MDVYRFWKRWPTRWWRRPELAGEDLERMMKELLLNQSFGPERLRKHCERLEAQEAREGSAPGGRCWGGEPGAGPLFPLAEAEVSPAEGGLERPAPPFEDTIRHTAGFPSCRSNSSTFRTTCSDVIL